MTDRESLHVIAVYYGGIPDTGYHVYLRYSDAMAEWEELVYDWTAAFSDSEGNPFNPDCDRYVTDGHDLEARWQQGSLMTEHERFAVAIRRNLIQRDQNRTVRVEVDEWMGCDEPWEDPVYITATDAIGTEYTDAVADLAAAPFYEQVEFVAEQLVRG